MLYLALKYIMSCAFEVSIDELVLNCCYYWHFLRNVTTANRFFFSNCARETIFTPLEERTANILSTWESKVRWFYF